MDAPDHAADATSPSASTTADTTPLTRADATDLGSGDDGAGRSGRPSWWRSALSGLLAAATALAVGELIAGVSSDLTSPVISVGNRVVDAVPRPLKDFAIEQFGTNDKKALLIGIYSVAAIFGLVLGLLAARRFVIGVAGIAAFGAVGVWAAGQEVGAPWWAGLPSVIGALAGIAVLGAVLATVRDAAHPAPAGPLARAAAADEGVLARRSFLKVSGGALALGVGAASAGRWLQGRFSAAASRMAVVLPKAKEPAAPLASGVRFDVDGISPFITPNADFYRIDTNLTVPQISAEEWTLTIKGMVDEEITLTYADVLALPMVEERITLTCVSNEVGGALVGTALWLGTPLKALLDRAGVQKGADQIVGRAFDGFTTGFPVGTLDDGRPALLAVGMNGEALPLAHGFPARIVVPGLYGYVSATKWLTEIELTTFDAFDQYWVERDWSAKGPIKTMTRIDTPRGLQKIAPGRFAIGGVAWAQTRGIEGVQVRIDDGEWIDAELADEENVNTWRQWRHVWEATPGRHQVVARAVDSSGKPQTEERARPFPDGASGWHSVAVLVGDG
jgi:DMSO/TMAO reductase YedYZ molybdopterin-dependent catalytic subunit